MEIPHTTYIFGLEYVFNEIAAPKIYSQFCLQEEYIYLSMHILHDCIMHYKQTLT